MIHMMDQDQTPNTRCSHEAEEAIDNKARVNDMMIILSEDERAAWPLIRNAREWGANRTAMLIPLLLFVINHKAFGCRRNRSGQVVSLVGEGLRGEFN